MSKGLRILLCVFAFVVLTSVAGAAPLHFGSESRPHVPPSAPLFDVPAPDLSADPAQAGNGLPTYFYVTTAVDVNGLESGNSNEASATLKQGMKTGVTLTWVAPAVGTGQAAVAGYNAKRSTVSGGCANGVSATCVKLNSALITGTTFVDPFVSPGTPTGLGATVN